MELEGKIALVTGAGHRLGRSIAQQLAAEGCALLIHYFESVERAEVTAEQLRAQGHRVELAQADLSRTEGVHSLFERLDRSLGRLDVLVNSAAVLERKDLLEATDEDWRSTVGLNLKGAYFCLQQAALRIQQGAIVNVSDTAAHRPWKRFPLHSISKAGLEMLTQVAALALAPQIRVNAVVPGPTLKPAWMSDQRWTDIVGQLPLRRAVLPGEVAQSVVFLLKNDYLTGHTLRVDGGSLL